MAADAAAATDEAGISRCGISGLYDDKGNPAALASGWLQLVDKSGRKRHRYFVLAPTFFAYFASEEVAGINEEGFMTGEADLQSLSALQPNKGASVPLSNVYAAEPSPVNPQFTLVLRGPLEDGTQALLLETANVEIASGWSDAINAQRDRHGSIVPPPRTAAAPPPVTAAGKAGAALSAMGGSIRSLAVAAGAEAKKSGIGKELGAMFGSLIGRSDAPTRDDNEYTSVAYWDAKGVDLMGKEGERVREDEHGHSAAVLHGWLTKKNKSGLRAGQVEKERYFVLTPTFLAFFPDAATADVRGGYLWGAASGEKIGGIFKKTGARLPLESVCEVRLIAKEGDARQSTSARARSTSASSAGASPRPASASAGSAGEVGATGGGTSGSPAKPAVTEPSDSDDEEDGKGAAGSAGAAAPSPAREAKPAAPADGDASAATAAAASASGGSGDGASGGPGAAEGAGDAAAAAGESPSAGAPGGSAGPASAPAPAAAATAAPAPKPPMPAPAPPAAPSAPSTPAKPPKPVGPAPSNLLEVDFGEFSLVVNAHNQRNRTSWATALRKWSGWRKRTVDEEMFHNMGTGWAH